MSLKLWLPLNNDFTNLGCSNITFNKHANNTFVDGKIGKALGATANNSSTVTLTGLSSLLANGKQYSLCCWAKLTGTPTSSWVIQLGNNQCGLWWAKSTARWVWNENDNGKRCANPTISGDYNNWHHLVTTIDKTNPSAIVAKHYVDGLPAASYETQTWDNGSNVEPIGDTITLYPYAAILNDIRLYDHVLSAAEVHEIAMGLVLHYKLDGNGFENENLATGTQTSITFTPSGGNDWFNPVGFYTSSEKGLNLIHNSTNSDLFTVSFDYTATNVEKAWELRPSLKSTSTSYSKPNYTTITSAAYLSVGNSSGHFEGTFYTTTGQREYGQGWLLSGATTSTTVNRNVTITIKNFKFEQGDKATCWCPSPTDNLYTILGLGENIIVDSSGYGHNGTITNGAPTISSDSPRYSHSMYFDANTYGTVDNIFDNTTLINELTWCGWVYRDYNDSVARCLYNGIVQIWFHTNYATRMTWNHATENSSATNTSDMGQIIPYQQWTHVVWTFKDGYVKIYINGQYKNYSDRISTGQFIKGYRDNKIGTKTTTEQQWIGKINDMRIYTTQLLDNDIKMLYNVGMKIDNLGGLHTFEINENGFNKLTKTGVMKNYMIEPFITLSDGSKWQLLLYHYVDNGTNLFTSSNAGFNNEFGLYSRLNYIDNFKYDNKYEFYVLQDGVEYRWTQTNAPLTTTAVTGFTAISGSPVSGICKCSGNTLLARTGATSNWWNACGSWTIYRDGIPGFGSSIICKQYLALYARISEPKCHIANLTTYTTNFIEI